jgi:hypothetical protein
MPKTLFSFPGFCSAKDRDLAKNVTLFYLAETPDSCCASFSTPLKLHGSEPGKLVYAEFAGHPATAASEKQFPSIFKGGVAAQAAGVGCLHTTSNNTANPDPRTIFRTCYVRSMSSPFSPASPLNYRFTISTFFRIIWHIIPTTLEE